MCIMIIIFCTALDGDKPCMKHEIVHSSMVLESWKPWFSTFDLSDYKKNSGMCKFLRNFDHNTLDGVRNRG